MPAAAQSVTPNLMPALHVGSPATYGPLTAFPVWTDAPLSSSRQYTTAASRGASVAEMPDHPRVNTVRVSHDGQRPRVLFEGTLLETGWQHRVVIHDVAVPAGLEMQIEVACVEQGRWGGGREQSAGTRTAPVAVRGATFGLRRGAVHEPVAAQRRPANQQDVWRRVARYERLHGSSATSSLIDVARRLDAQVTDVTAALRPLPAQRGVLIAVGGHPVLLEVFDHPRTLVEQWDGIVGSVWMDAAATDSDAPTPGHRAREFVRRVSGAPLQVGHDNGVGRPIAVSDQDLFTGRGLVLGDDLVHTTVLNVRHDLVLAA